MINELTRDNPRLLELEADYRASPYFDTLLKGSAWETFERGIDLQNFRGEAMYLTQMLFGPTPEKYRNTFDYVRTIDTEGYLERLGEDGAFGCITFEFDGVTVSRDLLDSVMEIYFLKEALGLDRHYSGDVLDIGAGYGRFAHRFVSAFRASNIYCMDAVPISSFLCKYYLDYRQVDHAMSVRLAGLEDKETCPSFNLAANIHSFSEMTLSAINFWLDFISDLKVPYLFVVPHDNRWICSEPDGSHPSFKPAIQAHGYHLMREQPKFPAGVDGIYPEVIYSLWGRNS